MGLMKTLNTIKTMGRAKMRLQSGAAMINGDLVWFFDAKSVARKLARAEYVFMRNWGRYCQRVARSSIKAMGLARRAPKRKYVGDGKTWTVAFRHWMKEAKTRPASTPGFPPHTHTGLLRKAILFGFDPLRESVVVGPSASVIDQIGAVHEFGGQHLGRAYPERPFMFPARDKTSAKLQQFWPKT